MGPTRFERFGADLWAAQGWNIRITRDSSVSEKRLIQVKRDGPNNPVGSPEVQQYASLRQVHVFAANVQNQELPSCYLKEKSSHLDISQ